MTTTFMVWFTLLWAVGAISSMWGAAFVKDYWYRRHWRQSGEYRWFWFGVALVGLGAGSFLAWALLWRSAL